MHDAGACSEGGQNARHVPGFQNEAEERLTGALKKLSGDVCERGGVCHQPCQ